MPPFADPWLLPAAPLQALIIQRRPVCREYVGAFTPTGIDRNGDESAPRCLNCLIRALTTTTRSFDALAQRIARVMRAERVYWQTADELTIRLGSHPVLLWPEEWLAPRDVPVISERQQRRRRGKAVARVGVAQAHLA